MKFFNDYWNRLPPRLRLLLLAAATGGAAVLATILLLRKAGWREVLYKAF